MHSGINQQNFEKKKLNVNCDKWTNVGESMCKGSLRLNDVCHCLRFTNPDF